MKVNTNQKRYVDKLKSYGLSAKQVGKYGFKLCLEVYEKYNRKCLVCGSENKLAIHHIDKSGQTENPNNSLDNLQLLCIYCHNSLHSKDMWSDNGIMRKQYPATSEEEKLDKRRSRQRAYYQKNKEKASEYQKKYRAENKDKIRALQKKYAIENAEKIKARVKKNAWKYVEQRRAYMKEYHRQYNLKNRAKLAEKCRRWRAKQKEKNANQ